MDSLNEELLALRIISNKNFADAYQLCKVLAWKFDIINCSEIIKRIEEKKYITITYPMSKTLKFFSLTNEGLELLKGKVLALNELLKVEFPDEIVFIYKLMGDAN